MGIVINQSIRNLIYTYIGFAIGAINTLFLYPYFMDDSYYGLVAVLLSTAMIFYPFLSFGMGNVIIRYYSRYTSQLDKDRFITFAFIFPIAIIVPLYILLYVYKEDISNFLSDKSSLLRDYINYIFWFAVFIGYFEVFYAYSKVKLNSVFGNLIKEISIRLYVTVLLVLLYLQVIDSHNFIQLLLLGYGVRTLVMAIYSISTGGLIFRFGGTYWKVIMFSLFIIFSSSVSFVVLEIDKLMVSQYVNLDNVAYYAVGGFIGIVVSVPGRAMQQILAPFVSKALSDNSIEEVEGLYKKSSINLLVISGFIFVLIVANVKFLYMLLPDKFSGGELVAIVIAFGKLFDMLSGINGTIITNSKYYKYDFVFGLILVTLTVVLNIVFIPIYGMHGAAFATVLGIIIYNSLKFYFLYVKFNMHPFSAKTGWMMLVIILLSVVMYYSPIIYSPIITIVVLSSFISLVYILFVHITKPSKEIENIINTVLVSLRKYLS